MADAGLLWKADPEFEEEVKTMNVFLRNSLVTLLFVWVLMSLAALSGCGTGDYNSKLDTAIQNAKSGAPPKTADEDGELANGDLQSLYPIDDEEEEAED